VRRRARIGRHGPFDEMTVTVMLGLVALTVTINVVALIASAGHSALLILFLSFVPVALYLLIRNP
jgi:hypothetical protein